MSCSVAIFMHYMGEETTKNCLHNQHINGDDLRCWYQPTTWANGKRQSVAVTSDEVDIKPYISGYTLVMPLDKHEVNMKKCLEINLMILFAEAPRNSLIYRIFCVDVLHFMWCLGKNLMDTEMVPAFRGLFAMNYIYGMSHIYASRFDLLIISLLERQ